MTTTGHLTDHYSRSTTAATVELLDGHDEHGQRFNPPLVANVTGPHGTIEITSLADLDDLLVSLATVRATWANLA